MAFNEPSAEGQGFSRTFATCQLYFYVDSTSLLESVSIAEIHPPEDPNRTALQVPPLLAHLVRLGELRRQFGREEKPMAR